MKVSGKLIDLHERSIYRAEITVENGKILRIERNKGKDDFFIIPGLIDAHVHTESSMVTPGSFANAAVKHGTVGVVSDPHEIANVLGMPGINYMMEEGKKTPLYFSFGAPSCVPATQFESSGAHINSEQIRELLSKPEIKYLSEMMNFPGVIYDEKEVSEKIQIAKEFGKVIDGHAPGLTGEKLRKYVSAGISTDHECSTIEEALEKISLGMKILIREGSAARNLNALKELFNIQPDKLMLCCDDIHPEMLVKGHINKLVARLLSDGYDLFDVLRSCTVNPVGHYGLESGLLRVGDNADFIVVQDYSMMDILETWIKGEKVFDRGSVGFISRKGQAVNKFNCSSITADSIGVWNKRRRIKVIEAFDGELLTKTIVADTGTGVMVEPDTSKDILKIVVKDRYNDAPPAAGFIKGFGLQQGAFASSIAHDSHNIVCIGTNDRDITDSINEIIRLKGGLAVSVSGRIQSMQLNIAGIMSDNSCDEVASAYQTLSELVRIHGCRMNSPFMTLSFMGLLVIPELKMSDKGLFDGNNFCLTSLFED
jgi:adenine deaminase